MEILDIEKKWDITYENEQWSFIKIKEAGITDPKILRKHFRALFASSMSTFGLSNSQFFRRYITGGFYITFSNGTDGIMLIFCKVKKYLDISFMRQLSMRIKKISNNKPEITINQIKNDEGEDIEEKMNKIINSEMELAFSVGEIINPKIIKFGNCYGIQNKNDKTHMK